MQQACKVANPVAVHLPRALAMAAGSELAAGSWRPVGAGSSRKSVKCADSGLASLGLSPARLVERALSLKSLLLGGGKELFVVTAHAHTHASQNTQLTLTSGCREALNAADDQRCPAAPFAIGLL